VSEKARRRKSKIGTVEPTASMKTTLTVTVALSRNASIYCRAASLSAVCCMSMIRAKTVL